MNWNIVEKEAYAVIYNVKHFRHFLIRKRFTIRVDSRVITYLQSQHHPKNRKLLNLALELSEYDCEKQQHQRWSQSNNRPTIEITPIFTPMEFQGAQKEDPELLAALLYIISRKHFDVNSLGSLKCFRKDLHVQNNVLMWKNKYVIPSTLRSNILELCHNHPTSGHFAVHRTIDQFHSKYFLPNAHSDVNNWVKSCQKCYEFHHPRTGYINAPLQPIKSDHRFQLVCYDLAEPFRHFPN